MKKLLLGLVVGAVVMYLYQRQVAPARAEDPEARTVMQAMETESTPVIGEFERAEFSCDGRQHCSEMRSCAEARYFLAHCPGVKMDGDGDGRPCERGPC